MSIDINQLLLNSYVISVNTNRYKNFIKNFTEKKLFPLPKLFNELKTEKNNGWIYQNKILAQHGNKVLNCSLSHLFLIVIAEMLDLPFICIFEDDAFPCKNIQSMLDLYLKDIPEDVDLLKMGSSKSFTHQRQKFTEFLDKNSSFGSHSYIVCKRYYKKYKALFYKHPLCDGAPYNGSEFYTKISNNNLILSTNKPLFIQYNIDKDYIHNQHDLNKLKSSLTLEEFELFF